MYNTRWRRLYSYIHVVGIIRRRRLEFPFVAPQTKTIRRCPVQSIYTRAARIMNGVFRSSKKKKKTTKDKDTKRGKEGKKHVLERLGHWRRRRCDGSRGQLHIVAAASVGHTAF